jgi:DNA invertase Pin-like site-specific DNA recombinase
LLSRVQGPGGDSRPAGVWFRWRAERVDSRRDRVAYRLCGEADRAKPPKLNGERQEQLRRLAATGEPVSALAEAFGIRRATAYRCLAQ